MASKNHHITRTDDYYQNYEEAPYEWFAWTLPGAMLQMTLGTISTFSSALILYIIICKSTAKLLNSTYHRIMALLSTFDLCLSSALALGTLPIPESSVPYSTPTLGTTDTCMAQGLMLSIGVGGVVDATLCLAWYYVCRILRVSTWTITRIYEPIFYIYIIANNATVTFSMLKNNYINIQHWSSYCGFSPIPTSCWLDMEENSVSLNNYAILDPKCQWPIEPNDSYLKYEHFLEYNVATEFSLIVLAMLIVILVVYQNERKMAGDDVDSEEGEGGHTDDMQYFLNEEMRCILRQASLFVLTCLVTWTILINPADENTRATNPRVQDIVQTILYPLGGFWNMLIFVYTKVCLIRDTNHDIKSNLEAFMIVITEPDSIPDLVLSGMENVMMDDDDTLPSQEESSSSHYASHPSAYDDLQSNTKTPSRSTALNILSEKSLFSCMAALNSHGEERLSKQDNVPSYGAVNKNRTDEEVPAKGHICRPMRRRGCISTSII